MKFIKESIEFPSSKNRVKECIHPIREEERRISRKWGHTWFFNDQGDVTKVRTKDGTLLPLGFKIKGGYFINGFDPTTNTVFISQSTDVDGGDDYAVEDVVEMIKHPVTDEAKLNEEIENKIYRVTYVVDKDANIFSAVMIKAVAEGEAQSIFLNKFPDTEILGIREIDDGEVETNKKKGMSLIEDLDVDELEAEEKATEDNPEPPVAGEESAAASIINSLIRDEWLAIEQYNSAMINLKEYNVDEKIIEVLNHIMFDENTHVGNLQEVLALLAPATDKIEKGNEQAEQILGTENKEVGV